MKYSTKTGELAKLSTDCLVVTLSQARGVAKAQGESARLTLALADFSDKPGKTRAVVLSKSIRRLLIVGGGAGKAIARDDFQKMVAAAASAIAQLPGREAVWALTGQNVKDGDPTWRAHVAMAALSTALYQFTAQKKDFEKRPLARIAFHADGKTAKAVRTAVKDGQALDTGMAFARDLGNTPPNICHPNYLLKEARQLAADPKVTVKSLDEKEMTKLGMGAFMSVSQGSDQPGRMIIIQYKGTSAKAAPHVLVGKGITFDTGGISLKPGPAMDEMKFDMCGAATVLGATRAVIDAGLKLNLVTIVAAAENMPSGHASRPGDVVTTMSGQSVEILNTDAEGRLVLCDALTYAEGFKPASVVDVATLTGACVVALGSHAAAIFSNDDRVGDALRDAGEYINDRGWPMPLWDEYQAQLRSNFADMANIGGREAGAVTAACFLSRYAHKFPWAHLDIAGVGYHGGARKGASGRPVPMLYHYLRGKAA
ncbi:MAG: leucyl aminopeptidase [Pseudomonadota bacterium]